MADPQYHRHKMGLRSSGLVHLKFTVLWLILPEVIFFTLVATMVTIISQRVVALQIATTLTTVFGSVLGFLISFRTSSAYSCYQEGRRYWSSIIFASRSFARTAWIHVPDTIHPSSSSVDEEEKRKALIEKTSAIRLVGGFCIALKHYCRGEASIYYEDLYPYVCYLPKYRLPASTFIPRPDLDPEHNFEPLARETSRPSSTILPFAATGSVCTTSTSTLLRREHSGQSQVGTTVNLGLHGPGQHQLGQSRLVSPHPLLPPRNPPPIAWDEYIPFFALCCDLFGLLRRGQRKMRHRVKRQKQSRKRRPLQNEKDGDNVPLEITLFLSGWVAALQKRKSIDVPTTNVLFAALQGLTDSLTGLERVLLSPMPIAYALHLRHVIWLYLLRTIPATALITFVFIGFLQIGNEIDNVTAGVRCSIDTAAGARDRSDLDLESYTEAILRELREIVAHPTRDTDPANFFFVDNNFPLALRPDQWEGLSATQVIEQETPISELVQLLRKGLAGPTPVEHSCQAPATISRQDEQGPTAGSTIGSQEVKETVSPTKESK
ncbi:BQ2448_1344 [Microbotryum intermedium]|uniref:BQ2448_1344 protein n=1 Tax=Microbotryum intermedium TaxID=269621 RepID=A0A238F7X4_9BASI|nr:BQ2448_1344 [Microbotryum intermedium]